MKIVEVELRRHSVKDGVDRHSIGAQGMALARLVGKRQLRGRQFTGFTTSTFWRTSITLAGFDEGAGDFILPLHHRPQVSPHEHLGSMPDAIKLWEGPCRDAEKAGEDMVTAAIESDPNTVRHLAERSAYAVRNFMISMEDGSNILTVGHSPSLEFIALGMFDRTLPQLQYCDGFRILFENGEFTLITLEDDPNLRGSALLSEFPTSR